MCPKLAPECTEVQTPTPTTKMLLLKQEEKHNAPVTLRLVSHLWSITIILPADVSAKNTIFPSEGTLEWTPCKSGPAITPGGLNSDWTKCYQLVLSQQSQQ